MRSQNFDVAILLLANQYAHLVAAAGIPVRVGERGDWQQNSLTHTFEIHSPREWGPPERLNAIRCLGYEIPDTQPQLWVDEKRRAAAREKLAALGVSGGEGYVVLHPFGSTKVQWWALERVGSLASAITSRFGLKVLLIGGPETRAAPNLDAGSVVDTRGLFGLGELMAVIETSRAVITTDSGPFHLAGALGRQIVGLFRSRRPEHARRYPTANVILGEAEGCEVRCQWDGCAVLPCLQMEHISPDAVADRLAALLKA
jgi:ADP-heptose:LPS heptosyltransferase